jgi:Beta-lactamase
VADREVVTAGGCGMYATTPDLARYVAALLNGGSGEHGSVLKPDTLAWMFQPHFQLDPRAPGWGLGFELGDEGGHRLVRHSGIVSGFLSDMVLAPDAGLGVVVFANTGGLVSYAGAPELLAPALLRRLLGLPDAAIRTDLPARPERWGELCGWYSPDPGPVANLFVRAAIGAGCEVTVHRGQLLLKPLIPIPAMRRGLRLYPDDPYDPQVFRVDLSEAGKPPTRVVFSRDPDAEGAAMRLLMLGMCLRKRPAVSNPRPWVNGGLAAGAAALAIRRHHRRR